MLWRTFLMEMIVPGVPTASTDLSLLESRLSRRQFLSLAALSLAISSCQNFNLTKTEPQTPVAATDDREILIIGAGMSGLVTAKALKNVGHKVRILEARNRLGGRTFTRDIGGAWLDIGGSWIHGDRNNPMAQYARRNNINYFKSEVDPEFLVDHGQRVNNQDFWDAWILAEDFIKQMGEIGDRANFDLSVQQALDDFFRDIKANPKTKAQARFLMELLAGDTGANLEDLSFLGLVDELGGGFAGGDHLIEGGYNALISLIAKEVTIDLNSPVEKIEYSTNSVKVITKHKNLEASHVIVTVPLGILKAGAIAFNPPLPLAKQTAIKNLGFGSYEKVILVYEKRFWQDQFLNSFATIEGLGEELAFPLFADFTEPAGKPTLVCLYSGAFAQKIQDDRQTKTIITDCLAILEKSLGQSLPKPIATYVTNWTGDRYSLGSYSYLAIGSSIDDVRTLIEPVQKRVLFAGEATSLKHHATVHGAFMTGLREAQRINPDAFI